MTSRKESDFLKRLLITFQGEAEERLRALDAGLIELENDGVPRPEVVESIFREVHSLKGAARSVNLMEIEAICQAMEDVFASMKRKKIVPSAPLFDALYQATHLLKNLLLSVQSGTASGDKAHHMPLIRRLRELAKPAEAGPTSEPGPHRGSEEASVPPASPAAIAPTPTPIPPLAEPPSAAPKESLPSAAESVPHDAPALASSVSTSLTGQNLATSDSPTSQPEAAPLATPPARAMPPETIELLEPRETMATIEAIDPLALEALGALESHTAQHDAGIESEWHLETATQSQTRPSSSAVNEMRGMPTGPELGRETVRIAAARLESLLLQVEELVSAKLAVSQRAAELRDVRATLDVWDKRWAKLYPSIRVLLHTLEAHEKTSEKVNGAGGEWHKLPALLEGLLEFVEWNHTWVQQLDARLTTLGNASKRDQRAIGSMVDHLLQDMKQILMLPIASILEVFPTATRELARRQEKEVQLLVRGAELEVDRRVLQEIKDPLMHLIRNSIDHGIESPDVREGRHKPRRGTITLTVAQRDSSKFEIVVADDGGGIDLTKVSHAAARLGLVSPENAQRMSLQETKSLLFQSGLSTSPIITDISGRGLGLAIVQEKVEKLGGTITLETAATQGTTFRLLLPLTLATLRGLLVRCEDQTVVLPITHVERVMRLARSDIQTVQNRETVLVGEQAFSLVRLGQALELPMRGGASVPTDRLFVVLLNAGEKRIAFWVDEILGEQEVLMKGLGAQLARVRNIAGATVLGNGQVLPIINVADLIKSAIKTIDATLAPQETPPSRDKSILIVEDSITARMQLKNILELSGYTVKTANDGLDALMTLRAERFDLIVSDVDMPRLNGLDLTTRIRNDKKLADLPVVLVTTLASRQDQARGIEVGANAYITKSNFDQNKLLDAIRRLI